jgi:hypothetical protein
MKSEEPAMAYRRLSLRHQRRLKQCSRGTFAERRAVGRMSLSEIVFLHRAVF